MWALLTLTLTAGVVAAFNPCGFAMLPAYLGYFISQESEDETNVGRNIVRGLSVGLTITAGFVFFFTLIGVITQTFVSQGVIEEHLPKLTFGFGLLMVPLGLAMIFGFEPKLNLPRLQKGGKTRGRGSIFMFGVSYAAVSLSCTAPIFFGTVIGSFTATGAGDDSSALSRFSDGMVAFLGYAIGMGMVVMALTLATAMARNELATFFRKALPHVNRASGVLLFFAGIFLVLYGWWEIQVLRGNSSTNIIIDESTRLQSTVSNWLSDIGGLRMTMAMAVFFGLALLFAFRKSLSGAAFGAGLAAVGLIWAAGESFSDQLFSSLFNTYGRGEFFIKPLARTMASIPERVGNWFTHTGRWETLGEVFFTIIVAGVIALRVRHRMSRAEIASDVISDAGPAATLASSSTS